MVLGYYFFELFGQCLYEYCYEDDLVNFIEYYNMFFYLGVIIICCYCFFVKGEVWIWVCSCCYVLYSLLDLKLDFVICVIWFMKGIEFSVLNQWEILERD